MPEHIRRPGRPGFTQNGVPSAKVQVCLRPGDYDDAYRLARQRRESVQDVLRRGLKRLLTDERGQ